MTAAKKLVAAVLLVAATSIFSITALLKERVSPAVNSQNSELVLYYGNTCPHCKVVEDYIAANNIGKKLEISQKEVFQDKANREEFTAKARICKLDMENLGVPMLWDAKNAKCYEGDQPIIDFLKQKSGTK